VFGKLNRSYDATGASNERMTRFVPAWAPTVIIAESNAGSLVSMAHFTDVEVLQDVVLQCTSETATDAVCSV
jgi:hypothetical protein